MRQKAEPINKAKKRFLRRDKREVEKRIRFWRACEEVSCPSFQKKATNLSTTHAEATELDSLELSEERLEQFGHDVALDVHYMFLVYTSSSGEGGRVEGSIVQLVCLDA